MFKIALQMYSLREYCDKGLDAALGGIAKAGYNGIETYSLHGLSAPELRAKLDAAGLACPSMHVGYDQFRGDIKKVIADAMVLGASFIVIPWTKPEKEADVLELADFVRQNSAAVRESGLKWMYHNHAHEFTLLDKGRDFFDVLLENTDSTQISLQVDTYWAEQGGAPIVGFIERVKARIGGFHLKDHREIGSGNIDFAPVLVAAAELGHEWLIVEQEEFDIDPYESIRISLENIRKIEKDGDA